MEVGGAAVPAREHAAAERAVGDGGDAELAAGGEQVRARGALDVECEGGVFDLDGADGVDGQRAAEGKGGAFGEAEVAGFAGVDGGGHGGDDGFDGDAAVEAVAADDEGACEFMGCGGRWGRGREGGRERADEPVPEIDVVGLQPFQTPVDGVPDVFGLVGENARAVCEAFDTEFGR